MKFSHFITKLEKRKKTLWYLATIAYVFIFPTIIFLIHHYTAAGTPRQYEIDFIMIMYWHYLLTAPFCILIIYFTVIKYKNGMLSFFWPIYMIYNSCFITIFALDYSALGLFNTGLGIYWVYISLKYMKINNKTRFRFLENKKSQGFPLTLSEKKHILSNCESLKDLDQYYEAFTKESPKHQDILFSLYRAYKFRLSTQPPTLVSCPDKK